MAKNLAAVLYGPCDLRIEEWPMPEINENDVLVLMECVGICGSDVKLYSTTRCGASVLRPPLVMGHEGAGVVHKVGTKVTSLKVGDRVAIEPTQPCGRCEFCKLGKYNHCPSANYSCVDADGNLCRYYKHVADFCHKIPDNLSLEEAAALQPLAVALHACNRAGVKLGSKVLILGAGPIGVLSAMTAKAMGASKIIMTEIVESRLQTAEKLVADYALLTKKEEPDQQIAARIEEALGARPDVTIDACACPSAQRVAMMVTKTAGVVLIVGIGDETVEVPLTATMLREVDIRGSNRILNNYPQALDAVSRGAVDLKALFTHHYPLIKTKEALELAKSGAAMKIIIHVQK